MNPQAFDEFQKGYDLQLEGRVDEAAECYSRSIEFEPSAEAYTFLGWALSHMGRFHEAIEQCHAAIRLDPGFGNPYNDIGVYMMELGRLDEAVGWFEKAKEAERYANPEFPRCNLGRLFLLKGNPFRAMQEFQEAIEVKPECFRARVALMRLADNSN